MEAFFLDGGRPTAQLMRDSLGAITDEMFNTTFRYDLSFLRRAYLRELWRTAGGYLVAIPFLLLMAVWATRDQDTWWFGGFLTGAVLVYLAMLYVGYRQSTQWAGREIQVTITDAGMRFATKSMTSEVPWPAFRAVAERADQIALTPREGRDRRWVLPRAAFSEDARAFIVLKVHEAGNGAP